MGASIDLENAARALTPAEKDNLRFHLAMGTGILAGARALEWSTAGAACVAWLAGSREVPSAEVGMDVDLDELPPSISKAWWRLTGALGDGWMEGGKRFFEAMRALSEDEAAAALARGIA